MVDLPDLRRHLIQEIPVVGDHHHRRSKVGQVALQPSNSLEVQVVGGLVQHQQVGVTQEGFRQRRPRAFAATG